MISVPLHHCDLVEGVLQSANARFPRVDGRALASPRAIEASNNFDPNILRTNECVCKVNDCDVDENV